MQYVRKESWRNLKNKYFKELVQGFHIGINQFEYSVHLHNWIILHIDKVQISIGPSFVELPIFIRVHFQLIHIYNRTSDIAQRSTNSIDINVINLPKSH